MDSQDTSLRCLVKHLAGTSDAIGILLQHKGLIELVIQAFFLETHRPDIVMKAESIKWERLSENVLGFINTVIKHNNAIPLEDYHYGEHATRCLEAIGTTPIVDKQYDKKGSLFVYELIARLRLRVLGGQRKRYDFTFKTLYYMIDSGCIDKVVISGVIGLVSQFQEFNSGAEIILCCIHTMLIPRHRWMSGSDKRHAFAVEQGLIETILDVIVKFQDVDDDGLWNTLDRIIPTLTGVSMLAKTSKAILSRRSQLMSALQHAENSLKSTAGRCREMLGLIKDLVLLKVDIEDFTTDSENCFVCQRALHNSEVKTCANCLRATYCSRKCQALGWRENHKHCCLNNILCKDVNRERLTRQNLSAVAKKIVAESELCIVAIAALQKYDILDCVLHINLGQCPKIDLKCPSAESSKSGAKDQYMPYDLVRKSKGTLRSLCFSFPISTALQTVVALNKHASANGSWQATQARFTNGPMMKDLHSNKQTRDKLGPLFCAWYDKKYLSAENGDGGEDSNSKR